MIQASDLKSRAAELGHDNVATTAGQGVLTLALAAIVERLDVLVAEGPDALEESVITQSDGEFLSWIHERLEHKHGEAHSADYMNRLRLLSLSGARRAASKPEVKPL